MIRVVLPPHLQTLARIDGELALSPAGRATQRSVLDALEAAYPVLRGTLRDQVTQQRRPFVRFFACGQDLAHEAFDDRGALKNPRPLNSVKAVAAELVRATAKLNS